MTSKRVTWIRWNLPYGVVKLTVLVVRNQGTANAGKALLVGADGMVAPGDVGGGGSGAITTFVLDNSFDAFINWARTRGSYTQFSGSLEYDNMKAYFSVGGSGGRADDLYGGGCITLSLSESPRTYYVVTGCTFDGYEGGANIRVNIEYLDKDGHYAYEQFFIGIHDDDMIKGAAFVIN